MGYGGYRNNRGNQKKKRPGGGEPPSIEAEARRLKMPREDEGEIMGLVIGLLGGSRMLVACKDGKERICRIPGRMKNSIWVRDGDIVIIKPWVIEGEKKGDVVWRYTPIQARILKERGVIKT